MINRVLRKIFDNITPTRREELVQAPAEDPEVTIEGLLATEHEFESPELDLRYGPLTPPQACVDRWANLPLDSSLEVGAVAVASRKQPVQGRSHAWIRWELARVELLLGGLDWVLLALNPHAVAPVTIRSAYALTGPMRVSALASTLDAGGAIELRDDIGTLRPQREPWAPRFAFPRVWVHGACSDDDAALAGALAEPSRRLEALQVLCGRHLVQSATRVGRLTEILHRRAMMARGQRDLADWCEAAASARELSDTVADGLGLALGLLLLPGEPAPRDAEEPLPAAARFSKKAAAQLAEGLETLRELLAFLRRRRRPEDGTLPWARQLDALFVGDGLDLSELREWELAEEIADRDNDICALLSRLNRCILNLRAEPFCRDHGISGKYRKEFVNYLDKLHSHLGMPWRPRALLMALVLHTRARASGAPIEPRAYAQALVSAALATLQPALDGEGAQAIRELLGSGDAEVLGQKATRYREDARAVEELVNNEFAPRIIARIHLVTGGEPLTGRSDGTTVRSNFLKTGGPSDAVERSGRSQDRHHPAVGEGGVPPDSVGRPEPNERSWWGDASPSVR